VLSGTDFVRYDGDGGVDLDTRAGAGPPRPATTLWSGPLPPHSLENVGEAPAGGDAAVTFRLFPRDQCRQLEGFSDRYAADLARRYLGKDEVVMFECPPEDRSRVAL